MELNKVVPGLQFRLAFGVFPSDPEAGRIVHIKINRLVRYWEGMAPYVEYNEEKISTWEQISRLTEVAKKFGYFRDED